MKAARLCALPSRASIHTLPPHGYPCWSSQSTSRLSPRRSSRWRSRAPRRGLSTASYPGSASSNPFLKISEEVAEAVTAEKPVVALESTIYTHGALGNDLGLEDVVRRGGAVPAVCGILDGVPTVGLTPSEVARMVDSGTARKASRRDVAYLTGLGITNRKIHGGTTIAGTMLLAKLAGIRVFGTGGLGGVHRGGENSMDVSADLTELGRTRVAVVSSGCKGFLDIPRTLEYLETQGAFVGTFADGRDGDVDFPAFWARTSGSKSPFTVENERDAAAMILAQERLGIESGMLFANPIPEEFAIPLAEMDSYIQTAVREANEKGFAGARNTPYVLTRIRQLSDERSTLANKELVRANVRRAARVAVELSNLIRGQGHGVEHSTSVHVPKRGHITALGQSSNKSSGSSFTDRSNLMVAGSVALDLSCDYSPLPGFKQHSSTSPQLETSNPAAISQSVGGVGRNVALAAHRVSEAGQVRLCTLVGDDTAGSTIISSLEAGGLDTTYIRRIGRGDQSSHRTAQYVAVNDADKNLVLAMADMDIFSDHTFTTQWNTAITDSKPQWVVVDGNWSPKGIRAWVDAARDNGCKVAFEPVSAAKSVGLFAKERLDLGAFPAASVDLASPNSHELAAMWTAARENGFFDTPGWWKVVDAFALVGARERFVQHTSADITDAGIPVQTMQLLPYIPTIITKLGPKGCLLTSLLPRDDPKLRDSKEERWILTRSLDPESTVGGVYMRMFPAAEKVEDVVSVNGVGDTFFGVLVAGLARGGKVEGLIDIAQEAAVLTLRSREAVSPDLGRLKGALEKAIAS